MPHQHRELSMIGLAAGMVLGMVTPTTSFAWPPSFDDLARDLLAATQQLLQTSSNPVTSPKIYLPENPSLSEPLLGPDAQQENQPPAQPKRSPQCPISLPRANEVLVALHAPFLMKLYSQGPGENILSVDRFQQLLLTNPILLSQATFEYFSDSKQLEKLAALPSERDREQQILFDLNGANTSSP